MVTQESLHAPCVNRGWWFKGWRRGRGRHGADLLRTAEVWPIAAGHGSTSLVRECTDRVPRTGLRARRCRKVVCLFDVFIWKPNRLGVPSYRESHVSGKGVPKSKEINIGMPQRRRQRVPQKWASKERRDCTRAVTDVGQGKRDKRLTPCYRSCACIWLTKNRKLIC